MSSIDGRGDTRCRGLLREPEESSSAYITRIGGTRGDVIGSALLSKDAQCANGFAGCIVSMRGVSPPSLHDVCGSEADAAECRGGFESAMRGETPSELTDAAKRGYVAARVAAPASVYDALRIAGVADVLY